jgi:hypothetical protein
MGAERLRSEFAVPRSTPLQLPASARSLYVSAKMDLNLSRVRFVPMAANVQSVLNGLNDLKQFVRKSLK